MSDKEHTPLPWFTDGFGGLEDERGVPLKLEGGWIEGAMKNDPEAHSNAEFIVEAVNNHERLLRENKRFKEIIEKYGRHESDCPEESRTPTFCMCGWAETPCFRPGCKQPQCKEALESPLDK